MGHAEVQTTTAQACQGPDLARRCSTASTQAPGPLADSAPHPRPACGSRMTGDCHVRFCERRRARLPPATHQKARGQGVAGRQPTHPRPLHPHLRVLAQPRLWSGSASSTARPSAAAPSARSRTSTPRSAPSSTAGTTAHTRSSGPRPPTRSSPKPTVQRLQRRDTREWTRIPLTLLEPDSVEDRSSSASSGD